MKAKLTLSINEDLIPKGKRFARKKGVSMSQLIERLLSKAIRSDEPTFSEKWQGKLKVNIKDESRFQKLEERFLK